MTTRSGFWDLNKLISNRAARGFRKINPRPFDLWNKHNLQRVCSWLPIHFDLPSSNNATAGSKSWQHDVYENMTGFKVACLLGVPAL